MTSPDSHTERRRIIRVLPVLRSTIKPLPAWRKMSKSAMKHFVSSYTGGIPLLVAILEKSQDQHIRHFTVLIIEKMLLHKSGNEQAQAFVYHGAVDHLLKLIVKCQLSWGDDFISALYKITAKIGEEDKKFAVKARFLGVLPIIVTHIKAYARRYKVLNTIMKLLKKIMASSVNATKLCKDGLPRELLHFWMSQKNDNHSCFGSNFRSNSSNLKILVHLTQLKIGREKLLSAGTVPSLLSWCRTLLEIPGNRYNALVILVSNVIQRCLSPRPLPVKKLNNPVTFTFSESYCQNESDSSDGKNDDTLSLASSTMSSADSGSDSDEHEMRPLDLIETPYGDSLEHFSVFFDEMNETQQIKPHFASSDEIPIEDFKDDFYDKYISSPVIEFKDLKLNSLIPKIIPKQPDPYLLRHKIYKYCEDMAQNDRFYVEVYNLDSLLNETSSNSGSLFNNDNQREKQLDHLHFEARFESGNLRKQTVVIRLISLIWKKSSSQFNEGMCPVMFSVRDHIERKQGWIRTGCDICYFRNHYTQGPSTNSILLRTSLIIL
ncbi:hypothetical protein CEXT_366423 [Caerostris extrusa]|uniref:Cytosolic carboxypeptidase 1 n=1 Tax=Caerostris extrusa TaxID=172846 RepID=A0AAV4PH73_CAEEX|nr:hypothetical protein CEXT_366423 [Caerostris extrusa]